MPLVMLATFYILLASFPIFVHFDKLRFILPIVEEKINIQDWTRLLMIAAIITFFGSIGLDFIYQSKESKMIVMFNMISLPLAVANYFRATSRY